MALKDNIENASTVVGLVGKLVGAAFIAWAICMGTAGMRVDSQIEQIEAQASASAARMEQVQRDQLRDLELAREGWGTRATSPEVDAYADAQAEAERRALQNGATSADLREMQSDYAEGDPGYAD
ncbi:MAG: hypothetical protein ABIT10_06465 [Alteraurantiacibacter sp.]